MSPLLSPPLVLASASPRRHELLAAIGVPHEIVASPAAEPPAGTLAPVPHARAAAVAKAASVARVLPGRLVLGADTVVALSADPSGVLGKPADDADAARMLRQISGRSHAVVTAVALAFTAQAGSREALRHATTEVAFRELPDDLVRRYVASGEPRDKAGAYAIQGLVAPFVQRIDGSFSNVVGLPLEILPDLFGDLGLDLAAWQDW